MSRGFNTPTSVSGSSARSGFPPPAGAMSTRPGLHIAVAERSGSGGGGAGVQRGGGALSTPAESVASGYSARPPRRAGGGGGSMRGRGGPGSARGFGGDGFSVGSNGSVPSASPPPSSVGASSSVGMLPEGRAAASVALSGDSTGRVKVCVRCRPAFREELDDPEEGPGEPCAPGSDMVVKMIPAASNQRVKLSTEGGSKVKEFGYDRVFPPAANQDTVYNEVGGPIVADVLAGYNGTVLAYGQTGTGKTYTMGILNRVRDEHSGLIPRALGHIFGHIAQHRESDWTVSLSFLQIYLETIQDLFSTALMEKDENLAIREDPRTGFYVEGLQDYEVRNFEEAVELLNWGLENRVIGTTKMNATSSRSHTVLTVSIEQRGPSRPDGDDRGGGGASAGSGGARGGRDDDGRNLMRTLRGRLVLVDLAGSERVRRTTSRGTRLVEAKSINVSLSALGNVIVALADKKAAHIPYRDSKLTRLLQDNLGGRANTYLIATIGPARLNESETMSTLLFASRCMRVAANPVQNEEVDYADLCAHLQSQVATMERKFLEREAGQVERYELIVSQLMGQIEDMQGKITTSGDAAKPGGSGGGDAPWASVGDSGLAGVKLDRDDSDAALEHLYLTLCDLYYKSAAPIREDMARAAKLSKDWRAAYENDRSAEAMRDTEERLMAREDPHTSGGGTGGVTGPHLVRLSRAEARKRVDARHGNMALLGHGGDDSSPGSGASAGAASGGVAAGDGVDASEPAPPSHWPVPPVATPDIEHPPISAFSDRASLLSYVQHLQSTIIANLKFLAEMLASKDAYYNLAKEELITQAVDRRGREEEMVKWSYVLKYLMDTNNKLRVSLKQERASARPAAAGAGRSSAAAGGSHPTRDASGAGGTAAFASLGAPSLAEAPGTTRGGGAYASHPDASAPVAGGSKWPASPTKATATRHPSSSGAAAAPPDGGAAGDASGATPLLSTLDVVRARSVIVDGATAGTGIASTAVLNASPRPFTRFAQRQQRRFSPDELDGSSGDATAGPPPPNYSAAVGIGAPYKATPVVAGSAAASAAAATSAAGFTATRPQRWPGTSAAAASLTHAGSTPSAVGLAPTPMPTPQNWATDASVARSQPAAVAAAAAAAAASSHASGHNMDPPPPPAPHVPVSARGAVYGTPQAGTPGTTPVAAAGADEDRVERIVRMRVAKGRVTYKVHWLGSSDADDEWFPRDDLLASFPDVVAEYERLYPLQ